MVCVLSWRIDEGPSRGGSRGADPIPAPSEPGRGSPDEVRCLTDQEILISDERGSEEDDLRVNGLPEGETPTGHEHAVEAGASPKTCRRGRRKTRVAG